MRRPLERKPLILGGSVTLVFVLLFGVVLGSFTQERSNLALLLNVALFAAVFAGGGVAGYFARHRHLMTGTFSAAPAAVLALVVQIVRWLSDSEPVPWVGLPLVVMLTASVGTLGGWLGARFSPSRHSLYTD